MTRITNKEARRLKARNPLKTCPHGHRITQHWLTDEAFATMRRMTRAGYGPVTRLRYRAASRDCLLPRGNANQCRWIACMFARALVPKSESDSGFPLSIKLNASRVDSRAHSLDFFSILKSRTTNPHEGTHGTGSTHVALCSTPRSHPRG
jgi:hypothetical protein